jgi:hypothetical protein
MRKIIAVIALCLLLLDGGYHLSVFMKDEIVHCKTAVYTPKSSKHHKYISKGLSSSIIDFTDLDGEEDDNSNENNSNDRNTSVLRDTSLGNWYLSLTPLLLLKKYNCNNNFRVFFSLHTFPIYIINSVLRI